MKFSIKDFLNGKLYFLCSVCSTSTKNLLTGQNFSALPMILFCQKWRNNQNLPVRYVVTELATRSKSLQLFKEETPTGVFSCNTCEIFKNIYFQEYLRKNTSVVRILSKHLYWNIFAKVVTLQVIIYFCKK